MAQVLVRGLAKKVVDRLKVRARANGRSLEAELRMILERASEPSATGEGSVPYLVAGDDREDHEPTIIPASRPGAYADFEPLKLPGKPLSEMIVEARRRT